jgi:transcriptional regulator with XRE-family HTH domain
MKRETDQTIGKRLKAMRLKKGIRQNFVADKLGLSNNFLSELESGKRRWYATVIADYERIVG